LVATAPNVVYLSNHSTTSNLKKSWSERKPSVNQLRVFGSIAYEHVPKQESRLDDRSVKHVFVGYDI